MGWIQIYFDDELEQGLKAISERTGKAESVHVRAAFRAYLERSVSYEPGEDPLLELIGHIDDLEGSLDVGRGA